MLPRTLAMMTPTSKSSARIFKIAVSALLVGNQILVAISPAKASLEEVHDERIHN